MSVRRSKLLALTAINAALYAVIGYASYLGIFTPVVGVVRFWPSVFVPGLFAVLFGEAVGGLGAAIGIFISDMAVHGNALLSLTVGVPANFLGFYTVGYINKRIRGGGRRWIYATLLEEAVVALLVLGSVEAVSWPVATVYIAGLAAAALFTVLFSGLDMPGAVFACSTGLMLGSLIIGFGVYAYSQFFTLPTGERGLPLAAALLWFLWTYVTEIPFLVALVPPAARAVRRVMPGIAGEG